MRKISPLSLLTVTCGALALAGCESVAEEVNEAVGFEYTAILSVASGGSGSGKAEVSLNDATNMICTDLELSGVGTVTAANILGPNNIVIADVDVPDDNDSDDCDNVSDGVIDGIKANPNAYSINVQANTGVLRGTLRKER